MSPPELMIVGRLRKAHGIRGELAVEPLTDSPADVFAAGRSLVVGTTDGGPDPAGRCLTVRRARPQGQRGQGGILVSFDEITERGEAQQWRGRYLLAPASELAPPTHDEVYRHELPGMQVRLPSGEPLGEVVGVFELPQGLALEVRRAGASVVLPFHEEFIQSVDRSGRLIVATPPEGLFE